MRAVIQRVRSASVTIKGELYSSIEKGLLVYLGIHRDDSEDESDWMIKKILQARIFDDSQGKMGLSILDAQGSILIISQITLYGNLMQGNRPDLSKSMPGDRAKLFFDQFLSKFKGACSLRVESGLFRADMEIHSVNDGPVTILLDSSQISGRAHA